VSGTVLDTSVYITALRGGNLALLGQRRFSVQSPLWLSAVVLEELYAGSDPALRKKLEKFEHDFDKMGRLLVPVLSDWTLAGNVLCKIGEKYGYELIGRARLTNDTLLAASVARRGLKLLTVNAKDFAKISEFIPLDWSQV
jgi:predicted nucleic acid-binding protein